MKAVSYHRTGIVLPKTIFERIDKHRGYYSRNRFLLLVLEEYMDAMDEQQKSFTPKLKLKPIASEVETEEMKSENVVEATTTKARKM